MVLLHYSLNMCFSKTVGILMVLNPHTHPPTHTHTHTHTHKKLLYYNKTMVHFHKGIFFT